MTTPLVLQPILSRLGVLALALALALSGLSASADSLLPQFSSVPVPRGVVGGLAQDRAGYLWVGTGNGLARWDGYRLQPMEREGSTAVQRNLGWVRAMAAARDGRLWIGTEADGLAVHDPEKNRIEMRGGRAPSCARWRRTARARIWIGTASEGLWRHDPISNRFESVSIPPNEAPRPACWPCWRHATGGCG